MKSLSEECNELAPLQTFDPRVFIAAGDIPQSVCNLVLALALIYNDYKDLMYADLLLQDSKPIGQFRKTRFWGAFNGINQHILRLHMSLLHELFDLIRSNRREVEEPAFRSIVRQLNSKARESWEAVATAALSPIAPGSLGKALLLARNKVVFHYDAKAISAGFKDHFLSSAPRDDRAFVSRGCNMQASRFYFADAAAQYHLLTIADSQDLDGLLQDVARVLKDVNQAVMAIVERFIQKRGFAFRNFPEPVT